MLNAVESQETAKKAIGRAKEFVLVLAFTFDRQDMVDALKEAVTRRCEVIVVADRNYTLTGKTRDQLQRLQELESNGAVVRLAQGGKAKEEYAAVGRSWSGTGILHAKFLHTERETIIGSCNWTTSSRANVEMGLHVMLNRVESAKISATIRALSDGGQKVHEAAVLAEQRRNSRSQTPSRGARGAPKRSSSTTVNFG